MKADNPERQTLTVAEAATRMKVNPETVRVWLRQGKLNANGSIWLKLHDSQAVLAAPAPAPVQGLVI